MLRKIEFTTIFERESEVVEVRSQILRGDIVVVAHAAVLERRPDIFNSLDLPIATGHISLGVIDGVVANSELSRQKQKFRSSVWISVRGLGNLPDYLGQQFFPD